MPNTEEPLEFRVEELKQILIEIQDLLAPKLDPYEQMLYHYIFRHTYLNGIHTIVLASRSIGSELGVGRKDASELSRSNIPKKLRCLEEKGAIKILGKSHLGTEVEIVLPGNIIGLTKENPTELTIDIENINFFSSLENREYIFKRDLYTCRYCLKPLSSSNKSLDHITAQADKINHGYKNLVSACFECNSRKHSRSAEDLLRENYRKNILTIEEFNNCVEYINNVRSGNIIPEIA